MNCLNCGAPMELFERRRYYFYQHCVVIDSCGGCDVIWVDSGDLKQIADAPGRDRGRADRH